MLFNQSISESSKPYLRSSRFWMGLLLGVGLSACSGSPDPAEQGVQQGATSAQEIVVREAHMRAMAPGRNMAAIYMRIDNGTSEDVQLVDLSTPLAGRAEVHRTTYEDGVMRMRHIPELTLPAGQTVDFSPGGYHVMLMEVTEAPAVGSHFDLELTFEPGSPVTVSVEVRPVN